MNKQIWTQPQVSELNMKMTADTPVSGTGNVGSKHGGGIDGPYTSETGNAMLDGHYS